MPSDTTILNKLIANAQRNKEPLTALIDQYYLDRKRSKNRCTNFEMPKERPRPLGRMSPSSLCGCKRQAVFKFVGMEGRTKIDPDMESIFDDGNWRHIKLSWMLKDMEAVLGKDIFEVVSIEEDVSFAPLWIAGSLDIVVRIRGVLWVIDFKGINEWGWTYMYREGKPKIEHVHQLIAYERMRRIKRGMIMYENKNDNKRLIYPVRFTEELWKDVGEWCADVADHMEQQQLPSMHPDCRDGRYLYTRCPFSHNCFGGKSASEIERITFRGFPGVEALWNEGHRLAQER